MRAALLCAVLLSGCSLIFVRRPDAVEIDAARPCARSEVWPVVDTVIAGAGALLGVTALGDIALAAAEGHSYAVVNLTALFSLSAALVFGASANHGFAAVAACGPQ